MLLAIVSAAHAAQPAVQPCTSDTLSLMNHVLLLEDAERVLSAAEVAALPRKRFVSPGTGSESQEYTRSAIWLRFELINNSSLPCSRWLTVGGPRLENVQVFTQHEHSWAQMQAGSAYPLEQWHVAALQPRFWLELEPGERAHVLARVVSRSAMVINPVLWDDSALLAAEAEDRLFSGLLLGVILTLALIGLAVGWVIRFGLLMLNALLLASYTGFTLAVGGYLFYLPELLPWSRWLIAVLAGLSFALLYAYTYVLFRVDRLSRRFRIAVLMYVVGTVVILLLGAVDQIAYSQWLFALARYGNYLLVPFLFLIVVSRKIPQSWLAWLFASLMIMQLWLLITWSFTDPYWWREADIFSVESALVLVLLLICTMLLGIRHSRQREQQALAETVVSQRVQQERLESQVEQRTQQLRDSLSARSSLLARISHDLRSPLSSIISYAREVRSTPNHEYLIRIERLANQQLALLDSLIALSQMQLQRAGLSLAPGYLFGFLQEIAEEGRFLASRQNNQLRCDLADDLPALVQADFQQLRRVLINLLNNAAKFTRDGSIVLQVERLATQQSDYCLRFTVRDDGPGLPEGASDQLLEAFQRGQDVLEQDGFGLGLSIVVELLKQMDAELRITSAPGEGSVFSFELQLADACEEELDTVFLESYTTDVDGEGCRIVLVDDIALMRAFLEDLLSGYGFDVHTAASAEEALTWLETHPADLLITDQLMPGADGWALLHAVRQDYAGLPVLLYSSSPPRSTLADPSLEFDAVLLKPATTDDLLEQIQHLCARLGRS